MVVYILELQKENHYLRDELLRVMGEPSRPNSPKGPILTEEVQILAQRAKDLKK